MRTTIDIPDSLFREVKTLAVQQGVPLKALVTRYIEQGLRSATTPPLVKKRRPLPAAIPRDPSTPMSPALSNRELAKLLEEVDLGKGQGPLQSSKIKP